MGQHLGEELGDHLDTTYDAFTEQVIIAHLVEIHNNKNKRAYAGQLSR
jgi:hypothetical protein